MSLLSYNELCDLVDRGVIGPVEPDCINASSIDIHLGNTLIVERNCGEQFAVVDPFKRTNFPQDKVVISDGYHYDLAPGEFVWAGGDCHLYSNHLEQADLQLTREPLPLPTMKLNPEVKDLFAFRFEDFELVGYEAHPHIKAPVAV